MKIFLLSGALDQRGTEPQWTVEEGVRHSSRWRGNSQFYFVEGTALRLSSNIPVGKFRVHDGYIYEHADGVGGFELRQDLSRHSRGVSFYICIINQGFAPSVTAYAHFQMPVYANHQRNSINNCSFWLLEPGEYLVISFGGKSWEVSNQGGELLIEEIGQKGRFLIHGNLDRMPDRIRLYYLEQRSAEIGREFSRLSRKIAQITGGEVSRYRRLGYGYFGDPLP